jgi:penicillin G amidase
MKFSEDESAPGSPAFDSQAEPRLLTRAHHLAPPALFPEDRSTPESSPNLTAPHRKRKKALKRFLILFVALVLACVLLLLIAATWLRRSMRAALPEIDGTLHLAGLSAPVTVSRDAQGVPSIRAGNLDDLLFAQGFVTAQDRLWQMDALRRHASGELAEILGPGLVDHDKRQRYLQLRAAAARAAQSLPEDQLREMQAYARGVNAFIDTHRDRLPVEFQLLHYQPRPWSPRDSLLVSLVMWQDLSTTFPEKLDREALARHLPPALLADLYPVGSWRDRPPTQPPPDLTTPHEIEEIPLDNTQSKLEAPHSTLASPADLLAVSWAFAHARCEDCRSGSNNWAVAGSRSASGSPLVSNDMHLGLSVPDIWYEAVLHAPTSSPGAAPIDIAGFTLPGVPWILVGRNAHVAWGFTSLGGDVQDLRVEHLRGSGATLEFEQPGGTWSPVQHQTEHIIVRGGHDVSLDVQLVMHDVGGNMMTCPILSPLYATEHRPLSLAWTAYDPGFLHFSFFAADTASDSASLVASFADFGGPSLNLIYADDHNHIGYHALGRIPIRGPAIQHPRATPQFQMPEPEPEPESEEDDTQAKLSSDTLSPGFQLTAYEPSRTRRTRSNSPAPQSAPPVPDQPLPTPPPPQSYTIGSPISPLPVDALDANQAWSGNIPYSDLPSIQDPPSGILATANARIVPDDYPYAVALNWVDPFRVERIDHLLSNRAGLTPHSMLAIQIDQHSNFDRLLAQRIAYAIDHASAAARGSDSARLRQAADLLRRWQGDMSASSAAAAVIAATHDQLWPSLLIPQIIAHDHCSHNQAAKLAQLYVWDERNTALENLLEHNPPNWLPPGVSGWNDLLTNATELGLRDAHAPRDLSRWNYGARHTIEIDHPLFAGRSFFDWLLGVPTGSGSQPAGGDATTIDAIGHSFGPSERFTADLSDPDTTLANTTTGQSGNPLSSWYLDQFEPWLRGTTFSLPLNGNSAEHTLTLAP